MWGIILSLFVVCGAYGTETERFYALRSARSPGEFELRRREFNLREAAAEACRLELESDRVPINCYRSGSRGELSESVLLQKCILAAQNASDLPGSQLWRFLPVSCRNAVAVRQRLLAYKAGKDFE